MVTADPTAARAPATAVASPVASVAASPSPASTTPASFQLTLSGDTSIAGAWDTSHGIDCSSPTYDGFDVLFFAQSPDAQAVVLVTLTQRSISGSERHGSGAQYTDREFQGTGVTTFDPARGASFNSDLTVVPATGQKPGTLGAITHISGSVDCGGRTPGASTAAASGSTAEGAVSVAFSRCLVACNASAQYGASVNISAIISTGATPALLIISLPASGKATIYSLAQTPAVNHSYTIVSSGTLAVTGTGAHVEADFMEVLQAGATGIAHTIHLAGDVTCGTFTTS